MTEFDLATGFMILVAVAGWLNARWLRLPTASAMLLTGLIGGVILLFVQSRTMERNAFTNLVGTVRALNFPRTVLGYLLAFLLFSGAIQVDLPELRRRLLAVGTLATVGVLVSTLIVSVGLAGGSKPRPGPNSALGFRVWRSDQPN